MCICACVGAFDKFTLPLVTHDSVCIQIDFACVLVIANDFVVAVVAANVVAIANLRYFKPLCT